LKLEMVKAYVSNIIAKEEKQIQQEIHAQTLSFILGP